MFCLIFPPCPVKFENHLTGVKKSGKEKIISVTFVCSSDPELCRRRVGESKALAFSLAEGLMG